MRILLFNCNVVNVFSCEIKNTQVLIENGKIIGVGDYYSKDDADKSIDLGGGYVTPGFIDGHIHIESTMLCPSVLAKNLIANGTTGIVADPHEIANVCGLDGIKYMLESTKNIPFDTYFMLPSCVPATQFDEAGAVLTAQDLKPLYDNSRVLGLAEVMNFVGVVNGNKDVLEKIDYALSLNKIVNGHAPLLSGKDLDKYVSNYIYDEHECSNIDEALEKLSKGQYIMIREGSSVKNLEALISLFDKKYSSRCMLVTDDKHVDDLNGIGHLNATIRKAIRLGADTITAIQMATINPATRFRLYQKGAIAPGFDADICVFDNLTDFNAVKVFKNGDLVYDNGKYLADFTPIFDKKLQEKVTNSIFVTPKTADDFTIKTHGVKKARVIEIIKHQLLTNELIAEVDLDKSNGISVKDDILKIAVIERHKGTGNMQVGFIRGIGLKKGAIASSVSHDSHNVIVIGTNEEDMAVACNHLISLGGGVVSVADKKVIADMPLPIAGVMSDQNLETVIEQNLKLSESVEQLGVSMGIELFSITSFFALPVIPFLKITTLGLINVTTQQKVDLFVD